MINKKTFTNADLNGAYQLVYTHNLNTEDLIPMLYDDVGLQAITADNFSLGDETGVNTFNAVTLSLNNPITGTWRLLLNYQAGSETSTGRRAFELSTGTPADDSRLIFGKAATPSLNITFTSLYAFLLGKLAFLKTALNLSDLPDKVQSRTNLDVYSTTEMNNALAAKATLREAGSGSVLGEANGSIYKPSSAYNPATKLYTEDMAGATLYDATGLHIARGLTALFDPGDGNVVWKITLPYTMANANYLPVVRLMGNKTSDRFVDNTVITPILLTRTTTFFEVVVYAAQASQVQSLSIYYELKEMPSSINVSVTPS
jgi:hypothetical protein